MIRRSDKKRWPACRIKDAIRFRCSRPAKKACEDASATSAERRSETVLTVRNCTKDEGGPFEAGLQDQASNRLKLLWSKAMVVSVEEKSHKMG